MTLAENTSLPVDVENTGFEIAVIGMAGRFPGAHNLDEFWRNLRAGVEGISSFSEQQVLAAGIDPDLAHRPRYVRAGGVLDGAQFFDAGFFGIYPQEAAVMDPQHRVFLETAWEALEAAGYNPEVYPGAIGVFAGLGLNTYLLNHLAGNPEATEAVHIYQLTLGNDKDFLPTRVSYKLNLRGPSVNVQTACSTSLVAVHLASQSLLGYGCDMALAGGITIRLPQEGGYLYEEGMIASPDGHCRPFDEQAQGTVGGNGVGVVVLKRLADALADGDTIHAVIKGSAINNDGSMKVGYTAPSVEGQAEVIAMAQAVADVDPASIQYVETHGTGTVLGDPIEVAALTQVFGAAERPDGDRCLIGSLKSNIGHLDAAAGVASLIKTVMALEAKEIPPSLHFHKPNPGLNLEDSPFWVADRLTPWESKAGPRRAGVSSFGIGGTNAHVVLEEAPASSPGDPSRAWQALLLSARSPEALARARENLSGHLESHPGDSLADIAFTLQAGRKSFEHRCAFVCRTREEALAALRDLDPRRVFSGSPAADKPGVAFMFTGQGAQYVNMAAGLYADEPSFREIIDRCCELLRPHLGLDLRSLIFPPDVDSLQASEQLQQTVYTQPALFVVEYALAKLWISWGIKPEAMIGHSIGEYVAACLAGVFSLEDVLALVAARGRLMGDLPTGAMLSVPLSEANVRAYLDETLSLAAVNAPELCVVSGPDQAIARLEARLKTAGVEGRRLHTSHAFHSAMMDPILEPFAGRVRQARPQPPRIPFVSNVTGAWITSEQATDPRYWAQHLRSTVHFATGVGVLLEEPDRVLLEVGPGRTLVTLARACSQDSSRVILSSLRHPADHQPDQAFLLGALSQLWIAGAPIDWAGFYQGERRRRVPLPTYPFERQRYWIEPPGKTLQPAAIGGKLRKRAEVESWFYTPTWQRADLPSGERPKPQDFAEKRLQWLILSDVEGLGRRLSERLGELGQAVVVVSAGLTFEQVGEQQYRLDPRRPEDYAALLESLQRQGNLPDILLHLWSVVQIDPARSFEKRLEAAQGRGFYSLLALAQALGRLPGARPLQIGVVSTAAQEVTGEEQLRPENAPLLGLCRVIPQEYPHLDCRAVDILLREDGFRRLDNLVEALIYEFQPGSTDRSSLPVAYRGRHRWVQNFEPRLGVAAPLPDHLPARLRPEGVYLITGGLGRIGLALAGALARRAQQQGVAIHLALVDRLDLPARSKWEAWLVSHPQEEPVRTRIFRVQEMEALGVDVLVVTADLSGRGGVKQAIGQVLERFGSLHGVFHAAGLVGEKALKTIAETGRAEAEAHFAAKVQGSAALVEALDGLTVDFVLLQSSLAAILGGLGMGAYAAANIFMDVLAADQNARGRVPWISVNWDGWRFEEPVSGAGAQALELALTPEEGLSVFDRLLSFEDAAQVVVSTADLRARLARWASVEPAAAGQSPQSKKTANRQPRPQLRSQYAAPRSDLELSLVEVWERVLGLEGIGVYDDFFELGGHSLMATQLVSRLRDTYGVELPLRKLFEAPVIASLAELIVTARRSGDESTGRQPGSSIIPVLAREGPLPVSYGQQRLWFLDQLEPGSPLYNNFAAVRLSGPLQTEALERSLAEIGRRHETLRTTFQELDGKPVQVITPQGAVSIEQVDLRGLPGAEQTAQVAALALAESRFAFNLNQGPLARVKLLRLDDAEHVVFATMHHIISDGWSVGVLIRELTALYSAYTAGQTSPLADLPVQYVDYAAWQRDWLEGASGAVPAGEGPDEQAVRSPQQVQVDYWKNQLAGAQPLELPTDRPRPPVQTAHGANRWFELPAGLSRSLETFSQAEGVTLFMTLAAALAALLQRYSGQEDICLGTPIANRSRSETENLIGFLLNTLVLRIDLSGETSFRALLGRVRETALGAYAHQDLPFETLVEALQPARDRSRSPFFQVMIDLQMAPLEALALPGVTLSPLRVDNGTAKFDLAFSLEQSRAGVSGYVNYNSDLFDATTIDRLIGHFQNLLGNLLAAPDASVSELSILTRAELHQLLVEWNPVPQSALPAELVHRAFAAQAANTPTSIALAYEDREMTYAELERRANALARYLRAAGVVPETAVGVCMERSPEAVVALLGTLKAGGAYVPLDPGYPLERLAFMLEDSQAQVLITQQNFMAMLQAGAGSGEQAGVLAGLMGDGLKILCLDSDLETVASYGETPVDDDWTGEDSLAYVIYTSGSTGQPKGVMVEHGALAGHCRDMAAYYALSPADRVLQFAALNFDAALEQILPALMTGARLVLRPPEMADPANFPALVEAYGLTVVNLPPAYWHQAAAVWESQPEKAAPQLRLAIIGGDIVRPESVALWQRTPAAHARLLNAYGPTETTITAVTYEITAADSSRPHIPIGRPLVNRQAYVLDPSGKPAPIGVAGELYLGGQGLARGYLNQPELTGERFVEWQIAPLSTTNPELPGEGLQFAIRNSQRLYRTGDLVRYLPSGDLEFLGRVDQQVKIRGFRIETGEIEAVLRSYPGIAEACVLAREEPYGEKRLVAYLVGAGGDELRGEPVEPGPAPGIATEPTAPNASELRAFLATKLPPYMVPANFLFLEGLPTTSGGKVDRRGLAGLPLAPDGTGGEETYAPPRTPLEEELARLWAEVLRVEWTGERSPIGIHDNFFDLGGHSLLATQLVSRVRAAFQVELPLRDLFETPTIAGLAIILAQTLAEREEKGALDELLAELEGLSDEDVQRLLAEEGFPAEGDED